MHRTVWLEILGYCVQILFSVALSLFLFWQFFHRPIVVLDIKDIVTYEKKRILNMKEEDAVAEAGIFFKNLSDDLNKRKEIVLLKEAVLNSETFKDITNEYKKEQISDDKKKDQKEEPIKK